MIHKMSVHHLSDLLHECTTQNLLRLPYAPHEGQNNPLRSFGQLEGNHRLDLLLLPFFHQGKKRKSGCGGEAPVKSPANLLCLPDE